MKIKVDKITDVNLLRIANSFTTGKESNMSLRTAYATKHSPCRTQIFWVELTDIPLFVASQFVRSHVGVQFFQRSKRTDRGGEKFIDVCRNIDNMLNDALVETVILGNSGEALIKDAQAEVLGLTDRFDRYAPTDLAFLINAEAIMNMSYKRLCSKASEETRDIWQKVLHEIEKVDPDLVKFCVKPCVECGGICRERPCCGFNKTDLFKKQLEQYKLLFL